jgi:hypothetical protein
MSYAAPVFLAACAYSLGMAFVSSSKEDSYDHLYDQLSIVKQAKDKALNSAQNNPSKLALVANYNKERLSMRTEHLNSGKMLTPKDSVKEMRKLDKQLILIQCFSPFDLLSSALFGSNRGWRRERPISLSL